MQSNAIPNAFFSFFNRDQNKLQQAFVTTHAASPQNWAAGSTCWRTKGDHDNCRNLVDPRDREHGRSAGTCWQEDPSDACPASD